jgi:hypothetical protein
VPSSEEEVEREMSEREKTSSQTAGNRKGCQDSKVTSASQTQTVALSGKDVESKKCHGQRFPRDHAVDGRASQVVRGRSYRLSLVFIGRFSLSRNFRHPACPGSTCSCSLRLLNTDFHAYSFKLLCDGHRRLI